MDYFINLCKKALKSLLCYTILTAFLWGVLYHITDFKTVANYFWTGVFVCAVNTVIANFKKRKIEKILYVQSSWVIMAAVVLILYHSGFESAAVFAASAIFASPFFGATIYEAIVGLSLLINLWLLIQS